MHCGLGDGFNLSRDLAKTCDQRVRLLYGQKLVKVSKDPDNFGGHRHCDSRDIMVFVYNVTLQRPRDQSVT